ncbi:hypothetical protein ACVIW0_001336 [Bradyrhizobium sp. USDA 4454]
MTILCPKLLAVRHGWLIAWAASAMPNALMRPLNV